MQLHAVKHDGDFKLWCGIAALSAISGLGTDHCKGQIRTAIDEKVMTIHEYRRRTIKGVYIPELLRALKHLGFESKEITVVLNNKTHSLATALHKYKPDPNKELYGIMIPGHYMTTDGTKIVDNHRPNGVPLWDHPYIEEPVARIWSITPMSFDDL